MGIINVGLNNRVGEKVGRLRCERREWVIGSCWGVGGRSGWRSGEEVKE